MGLTRRDLLTLGLGAAAAIPFTPIPWKLLDDTAKWSQNWSWIPRPPRGERSVRYSSCTLCPAGCGIQARCIGRNVIGIAPVAAHPVSQGVLCPFAFGAHQLPYHPARINRPLRHGSPASIDKVAAEISLRVTAGTMAILDERPGRAVSAEYQRIAAARGGLYLAVNRGSGLNLEATRTLVSFGVPILESWATPGRVLKLWKEGRLAIVQVEPDLSKTAALASKWLPVRPGSETSIASLLAGKISVEAAAAATGVPADRLADALQFIHDRGPMLAVSEGEFPEAVSQAPANSIDVLFIDHGLLGGSVSYDSLRPKLRPDGIIVSLSPYRAGVSAIASYVIPTPAFAESLEEAPAPWDAISPSYALAPPLLDTPAGVTTALEFIGRVTGRATTPEAVIRARVNALHAARRGEVFTFADRSTKPVTAYKSAPDLYQAFTTGACWIDRSAKNTSAPRTSMVGQGVSPAAAMVGQGVSPAAAMVGQEVSPAAAMVGQAVSPAAAMVGQGVSPAAAMVGQGVSPAAAMVGQGVSPAAAMVGQGVSPAAAMVGQGVSPAAAMVGQEVSPAAAMVGQGVSPAAAMVGQAVSPAAAMAGQGVSPAAATVGQGVSPAAAMVGQAVSPAAAACRRSSGSTAVVPPLWRPQHV